MKSKQSAKWMERLAERASKDIFFLGNVIAEFRTHNKLSNSDLANYIECTPDALKRLALCRLPDDQEYRFSDDIRHIADHVKCNADKLIALIREVNTSRAFRGEYTENATSRLHFRKPIRKPKVDLTDLVQAEEVMKIRDFVVSGNINAFAAGMALANTRGCSFEGPLIDGVGIYFGSDMEAYVKKELDKNPHTVIGWANDFLPESMKITIDDVCDDVFFKKTSPSPAPGNRA